MHQLNLFNASASKTVENNIPSFSAETMNSIETQAAESDDEFEDISEAKNIIDTSEHETENISVQIEKVFFKKAEKQSCKSVAAPNGRGRKSYKEMDADVHLVEVPDDEILFQKQYYSISEVAQWFNVNASLIRFWENEFDILKPRKNRKGDRLFRPEDIKNLQLIYYLLRQRKFSIEGARQYLKDNRRKAELNMQLIQSLTKFRAFLLELRATLDA